MFSHVLLVVLLSATEDKCIWSVFFETIIVVTLDLSVQSPSAIVSFAVVINKVY